MISQRYLFVPLAVSPLEGAKVTSVPQRDRCVVSAGQASRKQQGIAVQEQGWVHISLEPRLMKPIAKGVEGNQGRSSCIGKLKHSGHQDTLEVCDNAVSYTHLTLPTILRV